MKRFAFFFILATCISVAESQGQPNPMQPLNGLSVYPSPSLSGQALQFALSGLSGCGDFYAVQSTTTRVGNEITAVYAVTPGKGTACFPEPPPYDVRGPIGVLAPGDYTLIASGTYYGVAQKTFQISFTVPQSPIAAVEYHRADVDHYFLSADLAEMAKLDSGVKVGWKRTGETFAVVPPTIVSGSPVCRFYGRPEAGLDSHFFSAFPAECDSVAVYFSKSWQYESSNVFGIALPDELDGVCPVGMHPVYRFYNNRSDVNHRYTVYVYNRDAMIAKGWIPEGYGPKGVAMCTASFTLF